MDIEENIKKIVDEGNIEEMYKLTDLFEDLVEQLQEYDKDCAKKYEMKIYVMANGKVLTREMAEEIVHNMKPSGMRWSYEECRDIQEQYGIDNIRTTDFFIVMNSAYNDQRSLLGDDIDRYVKYTVNFVGDEDAVPEKVFVYFTIIPR